MLWPVLVACHEICITIQWKFVGKMGRVLFVPGRTNGTALGIEYPGAQGRLELAPSKKPCIPFISKTGQEFSWQRKKAETNPHGHGAEVRTVGKVFPWALPIFSHLICNRPWTKDGRSDHYHIDESPRRLFSFSSWQRGSERNHKHGGRGGSSVWVTSAAEGKSIGPGFLILTVRVTLSSGTQQINPGSLCCTSLVLT